MSQTKGNVRLKMGSDNKQARTKLKLRRQHVSYAISIASFCLMVASVTMLGISIYRIRQNGTTTSTASTPAAPSYVSGGDGTDECVCPTPPQVVCATPAEPSDFSRSTLFTEFFASSESLTTMNTTSEETTAKPTTPNPDPNYCHPDIVLLFDSSTAVSQEKYREEIDLIWKYVAPRWSINKNGTEAVMIVYGRNRALTIGGFEYGSIIDFNLDLDYAQRTYFGLNSSISNGVMGLQSALLHSRPGRRTSVILFTGSSNYEDIAQSVLVIRKIRSSYSRVGIFVVGLGTTINREYLKALSGSVYIHNALDSDFGTTLNNVLCTDSEPPFDLPSNSTTASSTTLTAHLIYPLVSNPVTDSANASVAT